MSNSRFFIVLAALSLGACATTQNYAPAADASDYGYYSTQLDETHYRIVFNGRGATDLNTIKDFALLRAAELTLQAGHDWFQIVDRETYSRQKSRPSAGLSYERAYVVEHRCGLLACSSSTRPATFTRFDAGTERIRTTHSYALEIVVGAGEVPENMTGHYDAVTVAQSLRAAR